MQTEKNSTAADEIDIYRELEEYPWDQDREFQGGLSAILGSNPSLSQIHDLTLRAQVFYISRKKAIPIDFDGYKTYLSAQKAEPRAASPQEQLVTTSSVSDMPLHPNVPIDGETLAPIPHHQHDADTSSIPGEQPKTAPYPPTFAQIVEMITSGAPIPGIREIPNITLPDQASVSTMAKRRKPWETDEVPEEQIQGKVGGIFGDERDRVIVQEYPEDEAVV